MISVCLFLNSRSLEFRHSIDAYSSQTSKLACRLLEFMAKGMGAEPESLIGIFDGQSQGMRMNYYPPCWQADKVLGLSPHTDAGGLTLLLQVNNVQGLQIKRDGKWFPVDALDGALTVNVGDTLEVMTKKQTILFKVRNKLCCQSSKQQYESSIIEH